MNAPRADFASDGSTVHRDLELLLCGAPDLDVAAWRANTVYKGAFAVAGDAHRVVGWFWEVLAEYAPARRAELLQWCLSLIHI